MLKPEDVLSAPVPGMSLTVEPGSVPWEQPPQHVTIQEVCDFYIDKLTTDTDAIDAAIDALEARIPLTVLANSAITFNVMKGLHTVDTGILVAPVVVELMKTYAELYDIPYVMYAEDFKKGKTFNKAMIEKIVGDSTATVEEAIKSIETSAPKGLMSKGKM